ncbi:MAG: phytase [Acidobacteria bacterium]|nr:phytase [Acidobacteriota bacterium]
MTHRAWVAMLCLVAAACHQPTAPQVLDVRASGQTDAVTDDPDDPAVWVHPTDDARSLILGTNKAKAPTGALVVFGLDGKTRQTAAGLDRPNNVDVEYGLKTARGVIDIAVVTERLQRRLRVFEVSERGVADITGDTGVFADRAGEQAAPMGVSLYRRPGDGVIFAIVAPKEGPRQGYLGQYRLEDDGKGRINARFVRYFGSFSGTGEIEAVAVDDAPGFVYYADEGDGIHKYAADPDGAAAGTELAHFGRTGFRGDREGIAIYAREDGTGYLLCTDQIPGNSEYHVFTREGAPGQPHEHKALGVIRGGADSTDGLEVSAHRIGSFQRGLMVAMNSGPKNFLLFRWEDIEAAIRR